MFKYYKYSTLSYLTVISTLFLGTGCYIPPVSATNYSVVAGSQVLVATVNAPIGVSGLPSNSNGPTGSASSITLIPLLGGFSRIKGKCLSQSDISQIDGWNGIIINQAGIIAGFTGTINGGVAQIQQNFNSLETTTFSGGLHLDSRGYPTAIGDAQSEYIDTLCATVFGPYDRSTAFAPNNESRGNKLANIDGYMWIYVSKDTPPGTYPLDGIFISQGPGTSSYASTDITQAGDTLTVIPPPCTIATETSINFETFSPAGRIVSAPITYQCGDVESSTVLDAYLIATAVGSPASSTELTLTSSGVNPGGIVRGYVGQGVDTDNVNCLDSANSLSFDGAFNSRLAPVSNGLALQIPLVWQLCLQGNEVPGRATGSVLLDIGYK